jgi:hypothetical protein
MSKHKNMNLKERIQAHAALAPTGREKGSLMDCSMVDFNRGACKGGGRTVNAKHLPTS